MAFAELLHVQDDHRKLFYFFCDLAVAAAFLAVIIKGKRPSE
jgi:hypothetical protein